jgi:hypothetical protein
MQRCLICSRSLAFASNRERHFDGTILCSHKCFTLYSIEYRNMQKKKKEEAIKQKYGDLFLSVVNDINSFKPLLPDYENELPYHIDLARWLEAKYPMLKVEHQEGSARPDIVIGDIAVEIKGPTYEEGLQSIADKCLRYHQHFKKMIVVLFDIRTKTNRFYTEWEEGLKRHFPDVMVIKK